MATLITQREEDGSIPTANPTGLNPGNVDVVFTNDSRIGDGAFGTTTGDFDFYQLSANAGSFITARVLGQVFGLDPLVRIYNSAGTQLVFNDDFDGLDSFVQFAVPTTGTYFVAVSRFGAPNPSNPFVPGSGPGTPDPQPPVNYRVFINNDSNLETPTAGADTFTGNGEANLLVGGAAADSISGVGGNDVIEGGTGNDPLLSGGAGDDLFIWRNGDGTDAVDGGGNNDRQQVFLSNGAVGDIFNISALGAAAVFSRTNLGLFQINTVDVERMDVIGLGGNDTATVNNLAGTALVDVRLFMGGGADVVNGAATATPLTIDGQGGNDTSTGGTGNDTWVFAPGDGADTITNFTAGNANPALDRIDLSAFANIHTLGDVRARATQVGADTVINFGAGDMITLQNVQAASLRNFDFVLQGAPADFNNDFRSDILWRNVNGTTNIYQMNGTTVLDSGNISQQPGNEWQIQDKNDFNADGMADILWRHTNGTTNIFQMNGRTVVDSGNISIQADNNWTIRGTDDFNADGRADILWRHANGTTNIYQMNGRTVVDTGNISQQPGNEWTIQDTADFNGDGFSDILWRHTNGTTNIYQMNGRTVVDSGNVSAQVDNAWKVQGTGDFNGDGNEDILWRNDNGTTNIHFMNGRTVLNSGNISQQPGNEWKVQDVKDYNGDNLSDILWRNDNGTTNVYLMNGLTVQQSGNISQQAANDWVIV